MLLQVSVVCLECIFLVSFLFCAFAYSVCSSLGGEELSKCCVCPSFRPSSNFSLKVFVETLSFFRFANSFGLSIFISFVCDCELMCDSSLICNSDLIFVFTLYILFLYSIFLCLFLYKTLSCSYLVLYYSCTTCVVSCCLVFKTRKKTCVILVFLTKWSL